MLPEMFSAEPGADVIEQPKERKIPAKLKDGYG
jgi:hypothetical protein